MAYLVVTQVLIVKYLPPCASHEYNIYETMATTIQRQRWLTVKIRSSRLNGTLFEVNAEPSLNYSYWAKPVCLSAVIV